MKPRRPSIRQLVAAQNRTLRDYPEAMHQLARDHRIYTNGHLAFRLPDDMAAKFPYAISPKDTLEMLLRATTTILTPWPSLAEPGDGWWPGRKPVNGPEVPGFQFDPKLVGWVHALFPQVARWYIEDKDYPLLYAVAGSEVMAVLAGKKVQE